MPRPESTVAVYDAAGHGDAMDTADIVTRQLTLKAQSPEDVRAQIADMTADQQAHLSPVWLERLRQATGVDPWTLGFVLVHRATGDVVGTCGFKGPPDETGTVEIAYGVAPDHQNQGYATEAAGALLAFAFESGQVRLVRAHTFAAANASARVLVKCGFQSVGEVIDPEDGAVWRWEATGTWAGPGRKRSST